MIAILKTDGRYRPEIVCDYCGRTIDDALSALAISSSAPEGTMAQAFHVHKGQCEAKMAIKVGGLPGSEELSVHLMDLIRNALSASDRESVQKMLDPDGGGGWANHSSPSK